VNAHILEWLESRNYSLYAKTKRFSVYENKHFTLIFRDGALIIIKSIIPKKGGAL